MVEALLGGLIGSILTALGTLTYAEIQRRHERSGVRAQIIFLLRQLQTHLAMTRDYPAYYSFDGHVLLTRLIDLSLTPLSASGLSKTERDAIFAAASQCDQELTFLAKDRDKLLEHGDREYVIASSRRAFSKLQAAREVLHDMGSLSRPSDPHTLHSWRPGDRISGSEVT